MGQENVVLEAFNLGADDYITKPFSPNELSMRVKRLAASISSN
jgi:DNA-binding response OmpR family regulator